MVRLLAPRQPKELFLGSKPYDIEFDVMPEWGCGEREGDMRGLLFQHPTIACLDMFQVNI